MRNSMLECERAGYDGGLATGLALALTGLAAEAAPGGVAALPSTALPAGEPLLRNDLAHAEGVAFVLPRERTTVPAAELVACAARLGAVRLGVTRTLLDRVLARLSRRVVGGEPIVRKQLVQGALADARVTIDAARSCLVHAGTVAVAVNDANDRLTTVDWELAKLLGAFGYAGERLAAGAHVSRLVANCWVPREAMG